jgi:hypothetical protein
MLHANQTNEAIARSTAKSPQTWQVPSGVTQIQVDVRGAQGGDVNYGGLGGRVRAVIEVTPSETLQINVGGQPSGTGAGFGGGGATSGAGHGGGGASDVRRGSYAPADRLVVGGGGGGAGSNPSTLWSMGGAGGGLTAGAGTTSTCGAGGGGAGGSQSAGGGGGLSNGGAGSLGSGGAAPGNAGGGGGGYYGGGSGGNGCSIGSAGGGGSSYAISAASGIQHELGFNRGNGVVTISWPPEDLEPVTPDPGTQTFGFTGSPQWWTVPDGVTAVRVEMQGAQGGNANYGGLGGRLRATIPVTPGESLQVNVGGHPSGTAGGLGGGGSTSGSGTGGGGASDIRRQGLTVADRVVVAGGGGGGVSRFGASSGRYASPESVPFSRLACLLLRATFRTRSMRWFSPRPSKQVLPDTGWEAVEGCSIGSSWPFRNCWTRAS